MPTNSIEKDALPVGRVTELTEVHSLLSYALARKIAVIVLLIYEGYRECAEIRNPFSSHFRR